ncbi:MULTISPECIES: hypothetical protein [unclassified Pseudomonas]|uniref:hypothetical protein n=1 Tax=unclassified Pseudomonas TaxID=196821 RepID=UPI0016038CE0|nr:MULTISPECIES: hypothetical protein [unclassified Pseudomonas]
MEDIEKSYRDTPSTNKKYAKRLTDYIYALIKHGRNIEAKHFFSELSKISPLHKKTIRLGYTIAIATFDNDMLIKYDNLLVDSNPETSELLWFQLRYYHSRNNLLACELVSSKLLEESSKFEHISTILEVCLEQRSYSIAKPLIKVLAKHKLVLSPPTERRLKQILIEKLINTIQGRK